MQKKISKKRHNRQNVFNS